MKKVFCFFAVAFVLFALAACRRIPSHGASADSSSATITAQSEAASSAPQQSIDASAPPKSAQSQTSPTQNVDVDLTAMNSTMIFAQVSNMMIAPQEYVGKTIRMTGQFVVYYGYNADGTVNEDVRYYACIIADATACCSQGLEFLVAGSLAYPDDYPPEGSQITVTGVFDLYEEEGLSFCRLIDASIQ